MNFNNAFLVDIRILVRVREEVMRGVPITTAFHALLSPLRSDRDWMIQNSEMAIR